MPKEGFASITIPRDLYDELEKVYDAHTDDYFLLGANSMSAFFTRIIIRHILDSERDGNGMPYVDITISQNDISKMDELGIHIVRPHKRIRKREGGEGGEDIT